MALVQVQAAPHKAQSGGAAPTKHKQHYSARARLRANVNCKSFPRVGRRADSQHSPRRKLTHRPQPSCVGHARRGGGPRPLFQAKGGFRATQETTKLRPCYHPPIHFIAPTTIPVLSPVLFIPSVYYTSYNSKNFFIYYNIGMAPSWAMMCKIL